MNEIEIIVIHGALRRPRNSFARSAAAGLARFLRISESEIDESAVSKVQPGSTPSRISYKFGIQHEDNSISISEHFWSPKTKKGIKQLDTLSVILRAANGILGDKIGNQSTSNQRLFAAAKSKLAGLLLISALLAVVAISGISALIYVPISYSGSLVEAITLFSGSALIAVAIFLDRRATLLSVGFLVVTFQLVGLMKPALQIIALGAIILSLIAAIFLKLIGLQVSSEIIEALSLIAAFCMFAMMIIGYVRKRTAKGQHRIFQITFHLLKVNAGRIALVSAATWPGILLVSLYASWHTLTQNIALEAPVGIISILLVLRYSLILLALIWNSASDVAAYISTEEDQPYFEQRESVVQSLFDDISILCANQPSRNVIILAHSLGSAYLLEAIDRLVTSHAMPKNLKRAIIFGSPLGTLRALGFHEVLKPELVHRLRNERESLPELINFWTCSDPISSRLGLRKVCKDRRLDVKQSSLLDSVRALFNAHGNYFNRSELWECIL